MTLKTIPIRITITAPDGTPMAGASILAELTAYEVDGLIIVPSKVAATTDSSGVAVVHLWPNERGVGGSQYRIAAVKSGALLLNVTASVPDGLSTTEVPLQSIINTAPYPAISESLAALLAAQAATVDAIQQAGIATTQATNAATSAASAALDAAIATTQAGIAATQAGNAVTSAFTASTKAGEASTSAAASAVTASDQAGTAATKAGEASTSAATATAQAGIATTQAGISTAQATTSATSAATATTKASDAATSATAASGSATTAATSASTATTKASESAASAASAALSAGTATTKAAEAATSAANAATSAALADSAGNATSALASKNAAAVSVTDAGTAAAAATAAKLAAEAARDAALIQAGVYTTEALGRAAVADGAAFKVQGSGDVAAYEYRRTNSTTSVLIATYPSYSGVTSYSQKGSTDLRVGVDLAATLTWTTGILEANGTVTAGYGGKYSDFVPVVPKATILKLIITNNYDTTRPNVLGYNAAQQPVQTLLANGTVNATELIPAYVSIPDGIAFVKICGGGASIPALVKKLSIEDVVTENLQAPYLNASSGNEFSSLKAQYLSTDAVGTVSGKGTGYVPVQVGDTIRYRGFATASIKGAGFYDSSKVFVRRWLGDTSRQTVHEYTLNALDDANVAYVAASDYQPDGTGFFTVERNKNQLTKSRERGLLSAYSPLLNKGVSVDAVLSGTTKTTAGLKYPRYTITSNPGYIAIDPQYPMDNVGHTVAFVAVKIKLVSLPSGTSTAVSWYDPSNTRLRSASASINVGDTVTMWNASDIRYIQNAVSGAVFDIIDTVGFWLDSDYAATLSNNEKTAIINDPLVFKRDYMLANYAKNSAASDKINTIFKGNRLVTFGDSVMASFGVPAIVSDNMQMTLTQLAISGSTPYANSNLSDVQLALIPADAVMVIITGGANLAAVISGDITTRDRTKGEGTINYAMDWIYTNRPSCRVMLATPPTRGGASLNWAQVFRDLAIYRKVPLADMDRDADINASNYNGITQYAGVHPTAEGVKRMAGVLIGALKQVIY